MSKISPVSSAPRFFPRVSLRKPTSKISIIPQDQLRFNLNYCAGGIWFAVKRVSPILVKALFKNIITPQVVELTFEGGALRPTVEEIVYRYPGQAIRLQSSTQPKASAEVKAEIEATVNLWFALTEHYEKFPLLRLDFTEGSSFQFALFPKGRTEQEHLNRGTLIRFNVGNDFYRVILGAYRGSILQDWRNAADPGSPKNDRKGTRLLVTPGMDRKILRWSLEYKREIREAVRVINKKLKDINTRLIEQQAKGSKPVLSVEDSAVLHEEREGANGAWAQRRAFDDILFLWRWLLQIRIPSQNHECGALSLAQVIHNLEKKGSPLQRTAFLLVPNLLKAVPISKDSFFEVPPGDRMDELINDGIAIANGDLDSVGYRSYVDFRDEFNLHVSEELIKGRAQLFTDVIYYLVKTAAICCMPEESLKIHVATEKSQCGSAIITLAYEGVRMTSNELKSRELSSAIEVTRHLGWHLLVKINRGIEYEYKLIIPTDQLVQSTPQIKTELPRRIGEYLSDGFIQLA